MTTLELAIKKSWDDVDKLTNQIESILQALKNNNEIVQVEADLVPLFNISCSSTSSTSKRKPKSLRKTSLLADSDDDSDVFMKDVQPNNYEHDKNVDDNDDVRKVDRKLSQDVQRLSFFDSPSSIFTAIDSETFFVPLINRWVWGTTIQNQSRSDANLPELYLSIPPLATQPGSPFSYCYSLLLLDIGSSESPGDNGMPSFLSKHFTIPYQKLFLNNKDEQKLSGASGITVPSGYKVWVTAYFLNPTTIMLASETDKISILASLMCDEVHQWSKLIEFKSFHAVTLHSDDTVKRFQPQIFSTLASYQDCFKLERSFAQGDRSPIKALEKFLTFIGFDNIHTVVEKTSQHIENQWFTSSKMSLLHGFLAKVEKNTKDVTSNRCSVSARSDDQMHLFIKILSNWLKKENQIEKKKGLKGMTLSTLYPKNSDDLSTLLFQEIEILSHLVLLNHKDLTSSEDISKNWLHTHITTLIQTDSVFMQFMKPNLSNI